MTTPGFTTEIIRYTIPAEQQAAFEKAYTDAKTSLGALPYCQDYSVIKGTDEPDNYIVIIHWTSVEDHLKKFRTSEEFKTFFQLVKPFYNNIREMKHYTETDIAFTKQSG